MTALVFLYKRVLNQSLDGSIDAIQACRKVNVPVLMTREEVATMLSLLHSTPQLVAMLLYCSSLRIMEAVCLRDKDIDFGLKEITVRSCKEMTGSATPDTTKTSQRQEPWLQQRQLQYAEDGCS